MKLSLVIPAFNEADRLAKGFERLAPYWPDDDDHEVIMVDDGSSDDTLRSAHRVYGHLRHFSLVRYETNVGKGGAVRVGLAQARGRHVIVADADMAIHPQHFGAIDHALDSVALAPGVRVSTGSPRYSNLMRTGGGALYHQLVRRTTGVTLRDTQCGCKGYRLGEGRLLALLGFVERFSVDAEMFYLALRLGLTMEPVPVTWTDVPGSSVHVLSGALTTWRELRSIPRTRYQNPAVRLDPTVATTDVTGAVREARVNGAVLTRGTHDALLVVHRHDALGAVSAARALAGEVTTCTPDDLRGREVVAL